MIIKLSKPAYQLLNQIGKLYCEQTSQNNKQQIEYSFANAVLAEKLLAHSLSTVEYRSYLKELSDFGLVTYYRHGGFRLLDKGIKAYKYRKRIWLKENYANIISTVAVIVSIIGVIARVMR